MKKIAALLILAAASLSAMAQQYGYPQPQIQYDRYGNPVQMQPQVQYDRYGNPIQMQPQMQRPQYDNYGNWRQAPAPRRDTLASVVAQVAARSVGADCVVWRGPDFNLTPTGASELYASAGAMDAEAVKRLLDNLSQEFQGSKSQAKRDLAWRFQISGYANSLIVDPRGYAGPEANSEKTVCAR